MAWRCQSSGYRQLCSLWFEYDLCLNRKPPSDHRICLMTMIRIRSTSDLKRLSYDSNMIKKPPSGFGSMPIKRVSTTMFSLVRIQLMFEQEAPKWSWLDSDMIISRTKGKPGSDVTRSLLVISTTCQRKHINLFWGGKKDRGPALLLYVIYTQYKYIHIRAGGSSIVRPKMSDIPRPAGLLFRLTWVFVLSNIDEVIWPIV